MSSTSDSRSSAPTWREDSLAQLAAGEFDLAIIGGGITGAGIARDAALRGLRVALVEKHDFGSGTSSKSSKLVHGGIRYMEQLEFGLVRESVRERRLLLEDAPHLVHPVPFMFPAFDGTKPSLFALDFGLWLYDSFARFHVPKIHRTYRRKKIAELEPLLTQKRLHGALVYYDAMTDDARLVLENILDAQGLGAVCASYTEVVRLSQEGGKVSGMVVRDSESGREFPVRARAVFAATGPWTDDLLKAVGEPSERKLLRPTKGVHIVVDRARLPLGHAVVMRAPQDRRTIFTIPWDYRTVIGTTDTDDASRPEEVRANADDVKYLLDTANVHFPTVKLTTADVISTWAGLRPLVNSEGKKASQVSREHELLQLPSGLFLMVGGKLTTYRHMAEQAVDRVEAAVGRRTRCQTRHRNLPGSVGLSGETGVAALRAELAATYPEATARHLAHSYGVRARKLAAYGEEGRRPILPGLPHVWAEIDFAVREDSAFRLDDVLSRRTLLLLVADSQGLDVAGEIAARMATLCSWDDNRKARELARYEAVVARSRAWQDDDRALPRRVSAAHLRRAKR